jgi:hypothetical protein
MPKAAPGFKAARAGGPPASDDLLLIHGQRDGRREGHRFSQMAGGLQDASRDARTTTRIATRVTFYSIKRQSLSMSTLAATASASLSIDVNRRAS